MAETIYEHEQKPRTRRPGHGSLLVLDPSADTQFGYQATQDKKQRKSPSTSLKAEDDRLDSSDRRKALNRARDLRRNFAIAKWALGKHLDYTSTFTFQSRNANRAEGERQKRRLNDLDRRIEELMAEWSRSRNFCVNQMHSRERYTRILEGARIVDGDVFTHLLSSARVQAIEGDRVRTPLGLSPLRRGHGDLSDVTHGVRLTKAGKPRGYYVCSRGAYGGSFQFEHYLPARHIIPHGYYERFDQVRGVSPLLAAVNDLIDTREAKSYAVSKMKVCQFFGLVIYRDAAEALGETTGDDDEESDEETPYDINLGEHGQKILDLEPGDKADFLAPDTPGESFKEFWNTVIACALKAVDIPFSFYDESHTNYSGQRQAWLQYELSASNKRRDVREVLDRLTAWRMALWLADGDLDLSRYGLRLQDIRWEWLHTGMPWIDPLKEVKADIQAVENGLMSRTRILRRQGLDFREIVEELKLEEELLGELTSDPSEQEQIFSDLLANAQRTSHALA